MMRLHSFYFVRTFHDGSRLQLLWTDIPQWQRGRYATA